MLERNKAEKTSIRWVHLRPTWFKIVFEDLSTKKGAKRHFASRTDRLKPDPDDYVVYFLKHSLLKLMGGFFLITKQFPACLLLYSK